MTARSDPARDRRRPPRRADDLFAALSAMRLGTYDDATRSLDVSPAVASSSVPVLVALRWGAVLTGLAWATPRAAEGDMRVVFTLAVAAFLASWRTVRPIQLGTAGRAQPILSLLDVIAIAAAAGVSDGLASPFVGCVLVAVVVSGFGWGIPLGIAAGFSALAASTITTLLNGATVNPLSPLGITALVIAALVPGMAQARFQQMEHRRRQLSDQVDRLSETNQLLGVLNDLARTLPSTLDLAEVLQHARVQLRDTLGAERLLILGYEDGAWTPQLQEGFSLPPAVNTTALPEPLRQASMATELVRIDDLSTVADRTGSGLYVRLTVDGFDTGLIGVENPAPGFYHASDEELLSGTAEVLSLTLANARAFRRLRSLAATEERVRIARDLHDRLGQWLTYIAFELERINSTAMEPSMDLKRLHEDTQGAIMELRDTLIELRTAITVEKPLTIVLADVVERFRKRSSVETTLVVPDSLDQRMPVMVENELLRIAQEALTNVEKHAQASHVHVSWSIEGGRGVLVVSDDGRGFTPDKGIRGTAYGLVGMRERAATVGAILQVTSEPGQGTAITVLTDPDPQETIQ